MNADADASRGAGVLDDVLPAGQQSSVRDVVAERLGQHSGEVETAAALLGLLRRLSAMMAAKLTRYAASVISEASSLILAFMDENSAQVRYAPYARDARYACYAHVT